MTITTEGVIAAETPAETYSWGRMVYDRARSPKWAVSIRDYASKQADALLDALQIFEAIQDGVIHPAAWYEDEIKGEAEPEYVALCLTAEVIKEWADELVRVFPGCAVAEIGEAA